MAFSRITGNPDKMAGAPCIRDIRMPVATAVGMVADGLTVDEIVADFSDLDAEDIVEALRYPARMTPCAPRMPRGRTGNARRSRSVAVTRNGA